MARIKAILGNGGKQRDREEHWSGLNTSRPGELRNIILRHNEILKTVGSMD